MLLRIPLFHSSLFNTRVFHFHIVIQSSYGVVLCSKLATLMYGLDMDTHCQYLCSHAKRMDVTNEYSHKQIIGSMSAATLQCVNIHPKQLLLLRSTVSCSRLFLLSQPNSTSTQVGIDKVISWTTTPHTPPTPVKLLRHFQTT